MADTYDVIIVGSGSGGGFLAGEIAANCSVLILEAGPRIGGAPKIGIGDPERRKFATQINLGTFIPDGMYAINAGSATWAFPLYADASNPNTAGITREGKILGGGSSINVGAWIRPRADDWAGFAAATGAVGWTKEAFEPHLRRAEKTLSVHYDSPDNWNPGGVLYQKAAASMGVPVFATASNRQKCIFCGHRNDAGMPCKYDALMSTAMTQIPKAEASGAVVVSDATVMKVEISNRKATGVTYVKNGQSVTVNARKLVVLSAGAIGTPLILFSSGVNLINPNVGKYLRAHPGISVETVIPGQDWVPDRGYQWSCYHYTMDAKGNPGDTLVYAPQAFPSTPWLTCQIGNFGLPYKNLMRQFPQRLGSWIFAMKPDIYGRVLGRVGVPVVNYPMILPDGTVEPKLLSDIAAAVRQSVAIFRKMGAIFTDPNPSEPDSIFFTEIGLRLPAAGIFHSQGTCRAGIDPNTSVVDSNGMSHDIGNLMCCDASIIPNHINANSNALTMAVGSRAADFVNSQILNSGSSKSAAQEMADEQETAQPEEVAP